MRGLLDADSVEVIEGDGNWEAGYEFDATACGRTVASVDICAPGALPTVNDALTGYRVYPWAVTAYQRVGTRCSPGDMETLIEEAMQRASGREVARNMWYGNVANWPGSIAVVGNGLYLTHADIATSVAGASVQTAVAAALQKAFDNHSDIKPIVHLGLLSAMQLTDSKFNDDDIDYVVSPSYPVGAVAVTGPITVHLGSIETTKNPDVRINRLYIEATRIVAVEFDPCLAVRAV